MKTYDYDLSYACSIDKINEEFVQNFADNPVSMEYDGVDPVTQISISLKCDFNAWQITDGGSGKILRVLMPIKSGTFAVGSAEYDLTDVKVTTAMQLGWIGSGSIETAGQGDSSDLVFNIQEAAPPGTEDPSAGEVSVVYVEDPHSVFTDPAETAFKDQFTTILVANQEKVAIIFAQIDTTPPGSAAWMTPKKWDYLYVENTEGIKALAILSVLTDIALPEQAAFDTSVLASGYDFFLILSQEEVLKNLIMPGLPQAFGQGTTASDFAYHSSGNETGYIENTETLNTKTCQWGLTTYYPKISEYKVTISNDTVKTDFAGSCNITGLANSWIEYGGYSTTTGTFSDSTHGLVFTNPSTTMHTDKHIPWYIWMLGMTVIIVDIIIAVVTETIEDSVEEAVSNSIPDVTADITNVVKWMGNTAVATDGGLEDCIWYRGSLSQT